MDPLIQKYHRLLLKCYLEIEKQLSKDLKSLPIESVKVMQKLIQEVNNIIANNNLVDDKLEIKAAKDKLELKLKKIIESRVNKSLLAENLIMEQIISAQMINSFIANKFVDELGGLDTPSFLDFSKINNKIDLGFEGKNFKIRNSINKLELKNTLNDEIHKFLNGETRARDIQKILRQKFAYDAYQAETLTRTEVATAQTLVHDEYARETGVQVQLFNATLDGKTSKICQKLDDTEWDIDDPNKPIPGIGTHPRCRSRLLNIPRPGWRPGTRRDNTEKFKVIPYQSYKEYYKISDVEKENVINTYEKIMPVEVTSFFKNQNSYAIWHQNLTEEQKDFINKYTMSEHEPINECLGKGKEQYKKDYLSIYTDDEDIFYAEKRVNEIFKEIEELKKSIDGYTVEKPFKTYRKTSDFSGNLFSNLRKGEVTIIDKSFLSTSLDEKITDNFAEEGFIYSFEINLPKGCKKGSFIGELSDLEEEKEFLFKPETKFKVIDIEKNENGKNFILEVLND